MEAIILAGGLGTRLRSELVDLPKSMAPINNRPFMEYLLDRLILNGVTRVIFSVGYKSDHIQNYFSNQYKSCEIEYAVEETLLGTGGAIKNAMRFACDNDVVVLNGDSIFYSDLKAQYNLHISTKADVTLALKWMNKNDRYGTVEISDEGKITRFLEKQAIDEGYISMGNYIFNVNSFNELSLPEKFSIEKDFFETKVDQLNLVGYKADGYFLDIGIPEAFKRAQLEIGVFQEIDKSWTLFLDRDGVINVKRDNDYVKNIEEFEFLPGAPEAIASLSELFGKIIIVTNQQGIGKGLMSEEDLTKVHDNLKQMVSEHGGHIDAIFHAPQRASENSKMRKPEIGMASQAKEDYPEIDFSQSIMIGDSASDMEFATRAEMIPVMVTESEEYPEYSIDSLKAFSDLLNSILRPTKKL